MNGSFRIWNTFVFSMIAGLSVLWVVLDTLLLKKLRGHVLRLVSPLFKFELEYGLIGKTLLPEEFNCFEPRICFGSCISF
jgi:hypothetical protein